MVLAEQRLTRTTRVQSRYTPGGGTGATRTREQESVEPRDAEKWSADLDAGIISQEDGRRAGKTRRGGEGQNGESEARNEEDAEEEKRGRGGGGGEGRKEKRSPQKNDGRTGPHEDHCGKWWEGRRGTAGGDWPRGGEQDGQDVGRTLGRDAAAIPLRAPLACLSSSRTLSHHTLCLRRGLCCWLPGPRATMDVFALVRLAGIWRFASTWLCVWMALFRSLRSRYTAGA
ncbi:hypothetical protein BO70DRAFT_407316 [Aspergillus heteromorphus CBS 117.55]|uniref:Uncharacterized protein n=1 Tax=Aspergillus heteromorphus CBS 117.55 TaxID=1448321 RepID=A0A317W6F8_9EURO|nr:uncharacterized protein BO70DRAFT_407316 [Aspergillus heteromorphus CBS 117.55]PWY79730.1 hypothetical protein BO70DRAFT_407316 [Aspergillus heteromorphus CBS 117.55]